MGPRPIVRFSAALIGLAASLLVGSQASLAIPKLQLHPVALLGYVGNDLRLGVELPCGGTFYGLVTRAATKGTLEVAAAVAQDNIVCTSMPRPFEVVVDYLATTGFKAIAPLPVDPSQNRLLVARV